MRPLALAALPLLLLAAAPATASGSVTVTVAVDASLTFPYNEPAFTRALCFVTVPAGSHGGDVLDAAVASGCLGGWSFLTDATFGRLVHGITQAGSTTSTDGRNEYRARFLCGATSTLGGSLLFAAWGFGLNGAAAPTGIDGYTVSAGDALQFAYVVDTCTNANSLAYFTAGTWPTSPVLLAGNSLTDPGTL
jgi:hypothetical protein